MKAAWRIERAAGLVITSLSSCRRVVVAAEGRQRAAGAVDMNAA